jgi:hypothetical protein
MKFLCISCDQAMKIESADRPEGGGSIAAVFGCPDCGHRIAMLTNPYETQLVQSLGVKIGPGAGAVATAAPAGQTAAAAPEGAADVAGAGEEAGGCPFSGMVAEMETQKSEVSWTAGALERLNNIPEFVRPMARQGIEHYAKTHGHVEIDDAVMEEARGRFGM